VNSSPKEKSVFRSLIIKSIEGHISNEEIQQFDVLLKTYPDLKNYYIKCMQLQAGLCEIQCFDANGIENNQFCDEDFWRQMAEHEKTAPEIEIPKEEPQRELINKVVPAPREKYEMSKFSKFTFAACAAVILFFVILKSLSPREGVEVATLTDSINAKWADIDTSMQKGTRFVTSSDKLMLREGYTELTFDNRAKVIIEAPAEFQILADDRISLTYGQVYAVVPPAAIGFSIYTPIAKIIDLGTEFGVKAETDGDTQLYVLKGKTSLIAGEETHRASIEVSENSARSVSGRTGTVSDVPFDQKLFVREINSETNVVWRGEDIELASIIAGGNGIAPVFNGPTLNPNTGNYEEKPLISSEHPTNYSYNPVSSNAFIDGVFVPDGSKGPVTITSQGHHFNCPVTTGKFNRNIAVFYKSSDKTSFDMQPALFDGVIHGSEERPCVLLHSNVGITIDLDRIRQAHPGRSIQQFQTGYGLTWAEKNGEVDFYILVDGILKHEDKALASQENSQSATIELEPDARFLTVVVTDSQKSSKSPDMAYEFDFFYLLSPRLILQ
jgi:hypothetical protein